MAIFFLIAGLLSSLISLACFVFTLVCYKTATGFVASVARFSDGDGDDRERLTVRFKAEFGDRTFRPFCGFSLGRYKPGDSIKVKYNPHIVWCCQAGVFESRWMGFGLFFFCGIAFTWAAFR